jgi:AcrR family transcriptional regulator
MRVARHAGAGARTWQRDPEGRRTRILEAASRAFAARGYAGPRTAEVARAAQVSEGRVLHLFGTKGKLLAAVGDAYGAGMAHAAFGADRDEIGMDDIPGVVRRIFRWVTDTDGALAAFLLAADPAEGAPAQAANRERMLAAIDDVVRRGMTRGEISRRDPRIAAELLFGVVENALRDCFLRGGGRNRARYERECSRCVEAYLRA